MTRAYISVGLGGRECQTCRFSELPKRWTNVTALARPWFGPASSVRRLAEDPVEGADELWMTRSRRMQRMGQREPTGGSGRSGEHGRRGAPPCSPSSVRRTRDRRLAPCARWAHTMFEQRSRLPPHVVVRPAGRAGPSVDCARLASSFSTATGLRGEAKVGVPILFRRKGRDFT